MSLIVDSGGKVTANPKTGGIFANSRKSPKKTTTNLFDAIRQDISPDRQGATNNDLQSVVKQSNVQAQNQLASPKVSRLRSSSSARVPSTSPINKPMSLVSSSRKNESVPLITSSPASGTAASMGVTMPVVNPSSGLDVWERKAAEEENRPVRTENYWGEAYEDRPSNSWFDNQLDYIGNTQTNDAYIRHFIDEGMPEDDAYDMSHHDRNWWENLIGGDREYAGDVNVMDDGTSYDYNHLTSDHMTGTQYKKYSEMGMGGLPSEEIVPSQVYSKRAEQVNNGFIPFTPDARSYANMVADNVLQAPSRMNRWIGDLRQALSPDYTINVDDKSFSGRDFDKVSPAYIENFEYESNFNPEQFLTNREGDVTPFVKEYEVPDVDGNKTYHYGGLAMNENGTMIFPNDDGTYRMFFRDGTDVDVSQDYLDKISQEGLIESGRVPIGDIKGSLPEDMSSWNDVDAIMQRSKESDLSPLDYAEVIYIPDLVLSDGQRLNHEVANRVYRDSSSKDDEERENDGIDYTFSGGLLPFTDNKPQRLTKQDMFDLTKQDIFDPSDLGDNMWDWTFGSIPISIPGRLPWLMSLSNGVVGLSGIDPASYDPNTGGYMMTAGSYDDEGNLRYGVTNAEGERDDELSDESRYWNALGNASIPLTEMIAGNVGSDPLKKGLNKITGGFFELPSNPTARQVLGNMLMDAVGEGVEEDVGNIFDDFTHYGLRGAFADPLLDESGDAKRDMMGSEIRDLDTPVEQRISNFFDWEDLLNSFSGGVSVSALMNALTAPIDPDNPYRQLGPALRRDAARRKTGVSQFVDPFENEEDRPNHELDIDKLNW